MIKHLYLKNLKCFSELKLSLAQLNLLTGFNAAGKSTAIQGLLLIAQALRQGSQGRKLQLNGPLVSLGTPGDVLGESDGARLIFGVMTDDTEVRWSLNPGKDRSGHTLFLESFEWTCKDASAKYVAKKRTPVDMLIPHNTPTPVKNLVNSLTDTVYISAIRSGTTDVFPSPEIPDPYWADVGARGEYAAWWFAEQMDEEVVKERRHPSESASSLRRQFNAWMGELFPGAEANAQKIAGTTLIRLELRNHEADAWRRPANIGYGITYTFPILVAGLLAKAGQILVIDSPEAHLHPMGQSRMGLFLAALARSGVQVVIETHSDHILNGVRLAVRNGDIEPKHVAINFFNRQPRVASDPAHVVAIHLNSEGTLSEWPGGFFDQSEKDLGALAGWDVDFGEMG